MHRVRAVLCAVGRFRAATRFRANSFLFTGLILGLAAAAAFDPHLALAQSSSPDSSIVVQWTAPGDDGTTGRATSYDLRYRTTAIVGTDTTTWWNGATQVTGEPTPGVAGAIDSMRVRGLTPLTTYYFIIRAADEVPNWSGYSNVAVKSTTGDNVAPAAITTLAVTGQTGNSISVRWNAPGNNGSTGTATSYDIRYSTSPITTANWNTATQATGEPAPAVAGTQQTFTLGGLGASTTYYVAMKASDGSGNVSGLSNVVSGTTSDTAAPAAVRDLSMREPEPGEFEPLAWARVPIEERNAS